MLKSLEDQTDTEIEISGRVSAVLMNVVLPAYIILCGGHAEAAEYIRKIVNNDGPNYGEISPDVVLADLRKIALALG